MADSLRIVEVGPRDGLQNESTPIPVLEKLAFIQALLDAGLREIEATSFVSPSGCLNLGTQPNFGPPCPRADSIPRLFPT